MYVYINIIRYIFTSHVLNNRNELIFKIILYISFENKFKLMKKIIKRKIDCYNNKLKLAT